MSRSVHQPRYTVALTAADVGERVMIRYAPGAGPGLTDAVGDLVSWDSGTLRVVTRSGLTEVAEGTVVAAKLVPSPRLAAAGDASVADLHRMSSRSWQALEIERLGGWRLRAAGGFTGRANSVLPLGDPGLPLERALGLVERWYAERGLVPRFQLPLPGAEELSAALDARGWPVVDSADVLVGDVAVALELAGSTEASVHLTAEPSDDWLAAYHYRGRELPPAARAVLANHDRVAFASVVEDGRVVAIARAAVDEWWLGLSAVEVAPARRRQGLGRRLMGGLLEWGRGQGARYAHLQVDVHNPPAHALYAALGFAFHHRYEYRVRP